MRRLTGDGFGALFQGFDSAFRWEQRQTYLIPREANDLAAFLRGEPVGPNQAWGDTIRNARTRSATMQRVRLVTTPVTDYTRFEIEKYQYNLAAGEDIRVLADPDEIPDDGDQDFWIFNDEQVALMHYDHAGRFLGAGLTTDNLTRKREIRDWALSSAIPLMDFLAIRS